MTVAAVDGGNEIVVAPGKALRLADMIDTLVHELHAVPLDESARMRFLGLYQATLVEVGSTLSDPLLDELARMQTARLSVDASIDEIRIALTQLEGWLHGIIISVLTGATLMELTEPDVQCAENAARRSAAI